MRWTVVLEQEANCGFVVTVPALPGCVSQGDSRDEAIENVREAIAAYVEDCRESGEAVPTESGREIVEVDAVELIDAAGTRLGIVARPPSDAEVETALARLGDSRERKTTVEVLARLMALDVS